MKAENENKEGKLAKGITESGFSFYSYKDEAEIPQLRLEAYLHRTWEVQELGMRKADLLAFTDTEEQLGNQAEFMKVQQLNGYMKMLANLPCNLIPSIYVISPLIVLGDEPLERVDPIYDAKKLELAKENPKIESFFLSRLLILQPGIEISSNSGELAVYTSPKQRVMELIFQKEIYGR